MNTHYSSISLDSIWDCKRTCFQTKKVVLYWLSFQKWNTWCHASRWVSSSRRNDYWQEYWTFKSYWHLWNFLQENRNRQAKIQASLQSIHRAIFRNFMLSPNIEMMGRNWKLWSVQTWDASTNGISWRCNCYCLGSWIRKTNYDLLWTEEYLRSFWSQCRVDKH